MKAALFISIQRLLTETVTSLPSKIRVCSYPSLLLVVSVDATRVIASRT